MSQLNFDTLFTYIFRLQQKTLDEVRSDCTRAQIFNGLDTVISYYGKAQDFANKNRPKDARYYKKEARKILQFRRGRIEESIEAYGSALEHGFFDPHQVMPPARLARHVHPYY